MCAMTDISSTIEAPKDALQDPKPRRSRWAIAAASLLAAGFVLILLASVKVPYLATSPGPVLEVQGIVEVEDVPSFSGKGELFLLTISRGSDPLTIFEWFEAWRDPSVDLVKRELVVPEGTTSDERRRRNLEVMHSSQQLAIAVALDRLGYDISVVGNGAYISEVTGGGPADGIVLPDDIIVGFDGAPVEFVQDLIDAVRAAEIGGTVMVTVDRADELKDLVLTLGESPTEPGVPLIGVMLTDAGARFEFPIDVTIDAGSVGGPSAGMMLSLAVYNRLTEDDITRGHRVAGTGSLTAEGGVQRIGGIRQKVIGAIGIGAEYILVPEGDFVAAEEEAGDDIDVIAVGTFDDALSFFDTLSPV